MISVDASMTETPKEAARRLTAPAIAQGFTPEALHTYRHPDGSDWYWRIRAKRADGEKWVRPMQRNGYGFQLGQPSFPNGRPLYGLDRIAANATGAVWIVEGEKAADALTKTGVIATTSGGSQSASAADWGPLRARS